MDPSSYMLKPLEMVMRLVKALNFLADPNSTFAEYMTHNIIRASATNSSISADATVVISQAHMGVMLFRQQRETSRILAGFVYKMLVLDEAVPTGQDFAGGTGSRISVRLSRAPTTLSAMECRLESTAKCFGICPRWSRCNLEASWALQCPWWPWILSEES